MKILELKKEKQYIEFIVSVDNADWQKQISETEKKLAANVSVKGFRKGKVPFDVAKKHLNMGDVLTRSLDKMIEPTRVLIEESKEFKNGSQLLVEIPSVKVVKIDTNVLELSFTYDIYPKVELGKYKEIKIDKVKHKKVSNEDVDNEINRILKHHKKVEDKKEGSKLESGDIANIDFIGYKDGKKFPGGESKGYDLEIGSNQFIPGFEDQLIGMKVGEERKINVTFPKDYHSSELAGAETVFEVKLNAIKTQEIPKLDDEFVSHENIPNVKTVSEFKKYLKEQIQSQYDLNYKDALTKDIITFIISITNLSSFPKSLVDSEKYRIRQTLEQQLSRQKLNIDKYLKMIGMSSEEFENNLEKNAQDSLKYGLAIEKIIDENKLEVTDKDLDAYFEKLAKVYNISAKEIKKSLDGRIEVIREQLLNDKVLDLLISYNEKNVK